MQEHQIVRAPRYFPEKLGKNLVIFSNTALEKIKGINSITVYEPRYNLIVGINDFNQKKDFLKQAFQSNMFNLLSYINDNSDKFSSFSAFLETGNDLERCLNYIQEDVENGFVPARYAVFLGYNVSKIKRWKHER